MTKKSFAARTWNKLLKFSDPFFSRGQTVLVGFSGGPDSVCLLHFLSHLASKKHFHVIALHVNHGLRGAEALADARFAKLFCQARGIEFITKKIAVKTMAKKLDLSLEHAARKGRYAVLEAVARQAGACKVALGHHLDDHAETVLLNLLRGTKAKGLAGIIARRPLNKKVEIVRPLLCITRAEVEEYLAQNELPSVTDQSNFDDAFTRNWIRHNLLPLLEKKQPQVREHLALMAADVQKMMGKGGRGE